MLAEIIKAKPAPERAAIRRRIQKACNVTQSAVSQWEQGQVGYAHAYTVAQVLGVHPSAIRPDLYPIPEQAEAS